MLTRRALPAAASGVLLTGASIMASDPPATQPATPAAPKGPVEAPFTRDYTAPGFKPSWKNPQINRQLVQDFVIYAHSDLKMTMQLLEKQPALVNAFMDWGNGDWESALGGAGHMGRRDIVLYLIENGARLDLFAATMLGMLDVVKSMLTLQPKLIDAKGPHGFSLHMHAQAGGDDSAKVLDYLQSIKKLDLKPLPFLKKK